MSFFSDRRLNRLHDTFPSPSRFAHITPLLRQLHWLRAPERIDFKLAVLVYTVVNSTVVPRRWTAPCDRSWCPETSTLRLASVTDCPTHTPVDRRRSVVSSRRSSCLEQSSTSCHVRTVSDCIPKSSEDLYRQSLFLMTSLYHIFAVPAQWLFVISDTLIVLFTYLLTPRCDGKLFHSPGPSAAKALSPKLLWVTVSISNTSHLRYRAYKHDAINNQI